MNIKCIFTLPAMVIFNRFLQCLAILLKNVRQLEKRNEQENNHSLVEEFRDSSFPLFAFKVYLFLNLCFAQTLFSGAKLICSTDTSQHYYEFLNMKSKQGKGLKTPPSIRIKAHSAKTRKAEDEMIQGQYSFSDPFSFFLINLWFNS